MRGLNEIRVENKLAAEKEASKVGFARSLGDWPKDHGEAVKPVTEGEKRDEDARLKQDTSRRGIYR